MESLREFICYNQKQIIKYEYIISNLHKDFRKIYKDSKSTHEEINISYEKLHIESFLLMENIFKENFNFIKNTFGLFDKDLRFTIKIINNEYVTDIYRSHNINSLFHESKYTENTAFDEIMNHDKKYFHSDNLEELYKAGKYKNPRLKEKDFLLRNSIEWKDCWNDYDGKKNNNKNYYNSTLVIPMSITSDNEDENSDFYNAFFKEKNESIAKSKTRTIWGFACFDSQQKDYFGSLKHIDFLDLGYIISDILSIYLVYFYNYTITSKTILEYENSLKNDNKTE